jgi:DNA-directed RNA polymerase specialized sigma24 family protein
MDFNQKLIDQMHKYATISAIELTGGKGSRKAKFFAEEAVSELLLRWYNKEPKNEVITDGFIFMSIKNTTINVIKKHNQSKKRICYLDYDNLRLDELYDGVTIEMIDEDTEDDVIASNELTEEVIKAKIDLIIDTLEDNEWITQFDVELFIQHRIYGKNLKRIGEEFNVSPQKLSISNRRIKNVLNYLYDQQTK